jgi:hypothetical protein
VPVHLAPSRRTSTAAPGTSPPGCATPCGRPSPVSRASAVRAPSSGSRRATLRSPARKHRLGSRHPAAHGCHGRLPRRPSALTRHRLRSPVRTTSHRRYTR